MLEKTTQGGIEPTDKVTTRIRTRTMPLIQASLTTAWHK